MSGEDGEAELDLVLDQQDWKITVPDSVQDAPARFEFIERALSEGEEAALQTAAARCKALLLAPSRQDDINDGERRWLVRRLVELRLRLAEGPDAGPGPRLVLGHRLQPMQPQLNAPHAPCDHCGATIWAMIHPHSKCQDCEFLCHPRCLSQVTRPCAHVELSEQPELELRLCPEVGLASVQRFRCAECSAPIALAAPPSPAVACFGSFLSPGGAGTCEWAGEARLCDYSGRYFCRRCHWGETTAIPARVVRHWDFSPRPVSRAAALRLRAAAGRPLLRPAARLVGLVDQLGRAASLRRRLRLMQRYLSACPDAHRLGAAALPPARAHLILDAPTHGQEEAPYSMRDLLDLHEGRLEPLLQRIYDTAREHITQSCKKCSGQGFYCELCNLKKKVPALYPFDEAASSCPDCGAAFHQACWLSRQPAPDCPRCLRREMRRSLQLVSQADVNDLSD